MSATPAAAQGACAAALAGGMAGAAADGSRRRVLGALSLAGPLAMASPLALWAGESLARGDAGAVAGLVLAQAAPASEAATGGDAAAREAKAPALPAVGTPLAVPAIERLDGSRFEPAQAAGRVLLLYWWASWCPFCAMTTPHVEKLWQSQRERGLLVLALSIDRKADDAIGYLRRRGYTLPVALVTPAFERACPKPKGLPVSVVRGRDGRVLQAEAGQLFPEDVEAMARHLG